MPLNPNAPWLGGEMGAHFESEMEINDFPQHARWKVRLAWQALTAASLQSALAAAASAALAAQHLQCAGALVSHRAPEALRLTA